jgi:hypothetical protein
MMLANADHEVATMGWNLLHDHRVSIPRFQEFEHCAAAIPLLIADPLSLQDAVNQYCDRRVHLTFSPDFLSSSLNSNNFHGRHDLLPALHGSKLLIRVLNLGRLDSVFRRAKHDGVAEFADYGASPSVDWLDKRLKEFAIHPAHLDRNRLEKHGFLAALLDYINVSRKTGPYQPVWATVWSEFSRLDWQQPERWPALLGVRPSASPTWLLLLRYPVRQAGRLVRPTQLDSGWYPEHFPTPHSATTGHPMELDATRPERFLLPEYIHQQIDHFPDHLVGCARVPGVAKPDLRPPQRRHFGMLNNKYTDVGMWVRQKHPAFP